MSAALEQWIADELNVLSLCAWLTGVGVLVAALEWLSLRAHFAPDGLYSWESRRTRGGLPLGGAAGAAIDWLYRYPNVLGLVAAQIVGALVLLTSWGSRAGLGVGGAIVAVSSAAFSLRGSMGYSGADQMAKLTAFAIALSLSTSSRWVWQCGIAFIAGQLLIAYTTPGLLRLNKRAWYDGSSLRKILRQHTFGRRPVWRLVSRYPWVSSAAAIGILAFECGAIPALFLPFPWFLCYLCVGIAFHLGNAAVMGLNTFVWVFVGAYPAALWLSWQLNNRL